MREILFRGKTKQGEWVEGFYVCNRCSVGFAKEPAIYENHYIYTKRIDGEKWFKTIQVEVIPETVGQFTGLTDKNGKKVFEGDIVKATIRINDWSRDGVRNEEGIYEIKYHTKHCYFYLAKEGNNLLFDGNWRYFLKEIKVIGNIHDNPELLGE